VSLLAQLQAELKAALKSQDKEQVSALRMIICELQNAAKEARAELDEAAEMAVLRKELKRRRESIEAFRAGGREDLVAHEEYAAALIEKLLPEQMNENELSVLIDQVIGETGATSPSDLGRVMSLVMARGGARVDGKLASRLVKERLAR